MRRARTPFLAPALLLALSLAPALLPLSLSGQESRVREVRRILSQVPLIDGHNDLPWAIRERAGGRLEDYDLHSRTPGDTDLERLREGMVGGQFWSVYVPSETADSAVAAKRQLEQIDLALRMIEAYPDRLELALTASDIERIFGSERTASLLGIEGGHAIENSLGALRAYYDLGVRYMTLTHFKTTDWADSATDTAKWGGLTPFGKEVVREMNRLGMLVDLSHVSAATMSDALDVAEAPVIFSHSGAYALTPHPRNVPDSILRRVKENGGVVMQDFYAGYVSRAYMEWDERAQAHQEALDRRSGGDSLRVAREMAAWRRENPSPRVTVADVADHLDHLREMTGIDHVGIGSDFDGIPVYIEGLRDVSDFPAVFVELSRRGWSGEDLRKLAGENLLRVMREAEAVSRRLRRERPPSTATFEELDGGRPGW